MYSLTNNSARIIEIKEAFDQLLCGWTTGNLLLVTHYYVMQVLFSELVSIPRNIASESGYHVPNAVPFVWDSNNPTTISLLDLSRVGDQH
jgi:hypothetical protein